MNFSSEAVISDVPILGIAGITFKVSDLTKAGAYYQGVLGLPEAFKLQDASGNTVSIYFKVNDEQYVEVTPDLKHGELVRQARVVFESSDVETLHAVYTARGVNTGKLEIGPDGNPVFHHRKPARVLIVVLVEKSAGLGIIWRINVNALHTLSVFLQQQVEGLVVFTMDKQPVDDFVKIPK